MELIFSYPLKSQRKPDVQTKIRIFARKKMATHQEQLILQPWDAG